jgi:NTE family protein
MKFYTKKKTALVLGGGAARGLVHLGILKVLRRENVHFDFVVGTSIGSLLAAAWVLEADLVEVERKALQMTARDILDVTISRMGLCKGEKLESLIREVLQGKQFAEAKIPLYIVTTDIEKGTTVVFDSGDIVQLVKASCSIAGIYQPVAVDGHLLVDGGITNNVPVSVAKGHGATHVVAVDAGYSIQKSGINNMLQVIIQSIQVMADRLNRFETKGADIVLRPDLDDINQTEFQRASEVILKGELIADRYIKRIKRIAAKGPLKGNVGFLWE